MKAFYPYEFIGSLQTFTSDFINFRLQVRILTHIVLAERKSVHFYMMRRKNMRLIKTIIYQVSLLIYKYLIILQGAYC